MASELSGGRADFFTAGGRPTSLNTTYNTNLNTQQQFPFQPPLAGILPDPAAQIQRPDAIGKRSLADFQYQNQQGLGFYLRNVKQMPNYSPVDFSPVPSFSPEVSLISNSINQHRLQQPLNFPNRNDKNVPTSIFSPNLARNGNTGTNHSGPESDVLFGYSDKKTMNHRLQELEKELLGDEEDEETVSVITNCEWTETIQNLIGPNTKPVSQSPTTSSSSSCCSTSAFQIPCTKQSFINAADAISDGKLEVAAEILTRLQQLADPRGNSEQRLTVYIVTALMRRVNPTERPSPLSELYSTAHNLAIQMLYEVLPCFKLGFMAANLAILESASEQGFHKIHVVDFDIGQGGQYMHFLHALAAKKSDAKRAAELSITTFTDFISGDKEKLKTVGENLRALANKIGVCFNFSIRHLNITDLSREKLGIEPDQTLAVNLAFKLHKLPDESVTTENLRDNMLRRVKSLSPTVTTVVEQDLNANTSPLTMRVRENYDYYRALFDSLETTMTRDNPDRVRIEEALGRKMGNSVACEGMDRVERCEMFGKWRARMSMAGFRAAPMRQLATESLRVKVNSGTRGNPGFTVSLESGGICFGWMGRTLTVASAWR